MSRTAAHAYVIPALAAITALLALASLMIGPTGVGLGGNSEARWLILSEIRLPRTLLGLLIGGALGLSGAALQGYLRNPLAEPGVIGISGGAGLGAVLAIHSGFAGAFAIGTAARRARGCGDCDGTRAVARGRARRADHAHPLRRRRRQPDDGADRTRSDAVAEPLRRRRDRVLADGLAH